MNKVVVTRPVDQAGKWLKAINEAGFESVLLPFIQTQKLDLPVTSTRNLSLYDACYLELSLRCNYHLATFDNNLKQAAKLAGVDLFY